MFRARPRYMITKIRIGCNDVKLDFLTAMFVLKPLFRQKMARTIIIFFIDFLFILQAIEGAVTPSLDFAKDYNHPRLEPVLSIIKPCMLNQYYDNDEGRCLIVPGGGHAVSIDIDGRCEKEIVTSDSVDKRRYSICRPSKIIHAECSEHDQVFSSRLKRCVWDFPLSEPIYTQFHQHGRHRFHENLPLCQESGKFPAPRDRRIFYTCTSNGFRLYRDIYSCPHNTIYNRHTQMCIDDHSYSTADGFSTTEFPVFPIKLVTIIPKTTTSNINENSSENSNNDILISGNTIQPLPIVSKNEAGTEHSLQMYISSTTEMPNLNLKSYKQNRVAVTDSFGIFYTGDISTETTPAPTPLDIENTSSRMKTTRKRVSKFYTLEDGHTTTLEPFFNSSVTEFPETIHKTLNAQEEESIIRIESNDDNNFGNTETDDITEIFRKSTTTEAIVTKPFSPSDKANADDRANSFETRDISSSTTPETELEILSMEEITSEEQHESLNFQTTNPTTESQNVESSNNPSMMYTSSITTEFPSSFTTSFNVDTLASFESSTIVNDMISSQSTTTEGEE